MQKKKLIMMAIIVLLISGCTSMNARESHEDNHGDPNTVQLKYETEREQRERIEVDENPTKDYYQSDEEGIATDGNESNIYATNNEREITQHLVRREDVREVQVATMGDRIIISITPTDYTREDIVSTIEKDVQKIVPNKEIIVFIENIQWK